MDENRAQAYLDLIQQLLTCPNGEEPQILQANSELLDGDFLQVCEEVATMFAAQGEENLALFLRNFASTFGESLGINQSEDRPESIQEYLQFIQDLFQAEDESDSDIAVVYPILDGRRQLLNARFAEVLQQVVDHYIAEQLEGITAIIDIIENLSIDIYNFPRGNRPNNLEVAIAGYQIVLSHREPGSEKWAQTQNNLATAYLYRIRGDRADNLENSIVGFYNTVIEVYTRDAFPEKWAQTQNNLANAYSDRIRGDRADNLEKAIVFYTAALEVHTRDAFPEKWAQTQNNLANAYLYRIRGERANNLEGAIASYHRALEVYTRDAFPENWAGTQNNLANAYSDRIRGERTDNLEDAIACYHRALEVYTRNAFPEQWAGTQNNLAVAYKDRIRGERADNLEGAIACYHRALEVRTRDAFPQDWAMTQNNLAIAYGNRIRGECADNLEQAIACYQSALEVYTRDAFPQDWAMTQNNLATAYKDRIRGERADNLEEAIQAYKAALTIRTPDAFPQENVATLNNLGWTYLDQLETFHLPPDDALRAATLQNAYHTFQAAIAGAENLRQLIKSGDEIKQKHDLQWDKLYEGMVQICLDLHNPQAALEYAEANKARNLAELIAQKQPHPQPLQGITYQQITQLLTTPDTALIEWYITDKEIIAFVLTFPNQLTVHRRRQERELRDLVAEYRQDYQDKDNWRTQLPTYLQRLAHILDIAAILPPDCQRAILIPHWFLHLFPLHALPLSDGEFLLDRFPQGIQYAPSCQLLQQIQIKPNFEQLLALQNPTADLKYTDIEVTSIAPKFPISQILPGEEASKTNLLEQYLQQLQTAHCAHFSCHGFFDPNAPLRSALILSGGIIPDNLGESDRYVAWRKGQTADITKCLTLADILQLQLSNCRLAVLSACETALIDTSNRSDYIGLPTGFLHAGAMGIIASLWAVNDISTALIVVKFYELLAPEVSIGIALHHTQRWFKSATTTDLLNWVQDSPSFNTEQKKLISKQLDAYNSDEKPYSDIYHWAAFCAIGL